MSEHVASLARERRQSTKVAGRMLRLAEQLASFRGSLLRELRDSEDRELSIMENKLNQMAKTRLDSTL